MINSSAVLTRPRWKAAGVTDARAADRRMQRRVQIIWVLLYLNVLTFTKGVSVIPIPGGR